METQKEKKVKKKNDTQKETNAKKEKKVNAENVKKENEKEKIVEDSSKLSTTLDQSQVDKKTKKKTTTKKESPTRSKTSKIVKDDSFTFTIPNNIFTICISNLLLSVKSDLIDFSSLHKNINLVYNTDFIHYYIASTDSYVLETNITTINFKSLYNDVSISQNKDYFEINSKSDLKLFYDNGVLTISSTITNSKDALLQKESDTDLTLKDNNMLIISEENNKIFLPYKASNILETLDSGKSKYSTIEEVINSEYVISNNINKNAIKSRFSETFKLMRKKEKKSFFASIDLALELMFKFSLNPAVIMACNNLQELNIYLDCLEENELEKYPFFKVIYKVSPSLS